MIVHVRILTRARSGRGFVAGAAVSENRTACGAPMTDRDVTPAAARGMDDASRKAWNLCDRCRAIVADRARYDEPRSRRGRSGGIP